MIKKYLVDEDSFSGQIVVVCESTEVEVQIMTNSDQVHFLYDEPLYKTENKIQYRVRAYYHYELPNREERCLFDESTFNKDRANQLFKDAVAYMR